LTEPVAVYQIKRTFRAPLDFAYKWCTDFTDRDRVLQGEQGSRQVIRKSARGVVYEDLTPTPEGWMWSRLIVTLRPPNRWHAVALGNYRRWDLDYSLRALPDGKTEFTLRGKRRPTLLGKKNPRKSVLERELDVMWRNLGQAMERDYRASRSRPAE
jgi:hypothetical protein